MVTVPTKPINYYLPHVKELKPEELLRQLMTQNPTENDYKAWLNYELAKVFPKSDDLIEGMCLDITIRDVTYETLNENGFGDALKGAFPLVDWDKPFDEYKAAKESDEDN